MTLKPLIALLTFILALTIKKPMNQAINKNESKIVIFAVGLSDTRRIPMTKGLLKSAYEINSILKGNNHVEDFINVLKKYQEARQCAKCDIKFIDTRIYIQIYKEGKLYNEAEICDGGECVRINNKNYCLDYEFYTFYLNYIPKINQNRFAPAGYFEAHDRK